MQAEEIEKVALELIASAVPRRFAATAGKGLRPEMERQVDLGIDSLALAAMVFRLEERCKVHFNPEELDVGQLRTVADIVSAAVRLVTNAERRMAAAR